MRHRGLVAAAEVRLMRWLRAHHRNEPHRGRGPAGARTPWSIPTAVMLAGFLLVLAGMFADAAPATAQQVAPAGAGTRIWAEGGTTMNVAESVAVPTSAQSQSPVPLHAPLHPTNVAPESGTAVR